ncbi:MULTISPECIES: 23S rRNA (adenine(2503)-C(2))-methyltransferase RlmN [unclassified Halanaerobium]|uniref:23S rRNA (adenine(2503)-C(2))-methyltransferase RlmN n=1 Tax=unclassified Halanaerobium TaxID=2641197 RepID=UPI000DF1F262|nr:MULTISPECIES: 23S rRNA (adenine(2503)-C(2))-methyltransferase RlmN [unclassified Halanaerobium]RCW51416.1 23S rRNA m(2)A-2503 methyltransferase [Halanaerobium sp. MA284_MarDTE_T2]RCW89205.1 23S rRNA m(2)A-2503 methyltransferase [Halanaerobium sp. DL-01]
MKDLKSLTRNELMESINNLGYPNYRGEQVFNWIYRNGISDYDLMTNIPKKMRKDLQTDFKITDIELLEKKKAADGTIKYLWKLKDGENIESVYIPFEESGRHSICISSQVGCALGCSFCATGIDGLQRDLNTGEIIDQVLKIQQDISKETFGSPRISNIVYMGMGEPLANLKNVLKSAEIINENDGLNIGMRKMTISTAGLVPEIKELAEKNNQIGLAVSLHAPNDRLRNKLMPVNRKYSITQLLSAVNYYIEKTGRRVTFEYVLMDGVNDSPELAIQLADLLRGINCHINLIPANPVPALNIKKPVQKVLDKFYEILVNRGLQVTVRKEMGSEIEAACGQLKRKHS